MEEKQQLLLEEILDQEIHFLREILSALSLEEIALTENQLIKFESLLDSRKVLQKNLKNLQKKRGRILPNIQSDKSYLSIPDSIENCTLKSKESQLEAIHQKIQSQKKVTRKLAKMAKHGVLFLPGLIPEERKPSLQIGLLEKTN